MAKDLTDANLIMRISHGGYSVADPFVQEVWQERTALGPLAPGSGNSAST